jgi:Family of unknown function (DUF6516)
MLHEMLAQYLERIEQAVVRCSNTYVERYTEEILTSERVNLRIRLRFESGHLLEINEAVAMIDNTLVPLDYRYHCQDNQNRLVFRYDSTPHFPELSSFPHHKHLPDQVIACEKPDLEQVLQEIIEMLA